MKRIPEPELMEGPEQSKAYAEADFSQANSQFIRLFSAAFPDFTGKARVLDLGCGPGHILMDFAQKFPDCACLGIDGSAAHAQPPSFENLFRSCVTICPTYPPFFRKDLFYWTEGLFQVDYYHLGGL